MRVLRVSSKCRLLPHISQEVAICGFIHKHPGSKIPIITSYLLVDISLHYGDTPNTPNWPATLIYNFLKKFLFRHKFMSTINKEYK